MNNLILSILGIAVVSVGQAQILLHWGDNYVSANSNIQATPPFNAEILSTAQVRNPATNYSGPQFFGGTWQTSTKTISSAQVQNNSFRDLIHIQWGNTNSAGSHAGLIFFKSGVFSNVWSSGNQQFDFSITGRLAAFAIPSLVSQDIRLVVQSGDNFYVSDNSGTFAINSTTITDSATYAANTSTLNFTGIDQWRSYDPVTSITGALGTANPVAFTAIDAVGVYFAAVTNTSAGNNLPFQFYALTVTAVPEPSTYAMLLGALALGVVAVRRRMKR
jgi:hypothetical protein